MSKSFNPNQVSVQKVESSAILPAYGSNGAAGADLCAVHDAVIPTAQQRIVATGVAISLPPHTGARIEDRSSLATKHMLSVVGGRIDSDYRGEILVALYNRGINEVYLQKGERIAQLVIHPIIRAEFHAVDSLDQTERGQGGFGSTGRWGK